MSLQATSLSTDPPVYQMATLEERLLGLDFTAYLNEGESIGSVSSVSLIDLSSKTSVTPGDPPSIVGNIVTQWIRGPLVLTAGHTYALVITISTSESQVESGQLNIPVPF